MTIPRRDFVRLAAGAAALPVLSQVAAADHYPGKPVRILVGYAAGGATAPADFGKLIADDTEKWAKVVKFAGIKAD
jgi:tripartite-type tricarboxylate transporter receptor subunit TctC